jgi:hypothetical protein
MKIIIAYIPIRFLADAMVVTISLTTPIGSALQGWMCHGRCQWDQCHSPYGPCVRQMQNM